MDQYLIYLRKSRQDRDAEAQGAGDTLARHRAALLDLARRMDLFISAIYEEVVSGETISARPEMQKLLRDVETGAYAGVLVMEVERLARGNTKDQGIVAETFQYSGAKIITPNKIYDPEDEADQEYFEFGLFMSRREYKTINRRLQRGRAASLHEGKYIAGTAPYGYRRIKLPRQKGYSLEIIPEQADVVRRIFDLYVTGERQLDGDLRQLGAFLIAKKLDAEGIPSPSGGKWPPCTVKDILLNPTYAGMLRWSYRPTVRRMHDGVVSETRPVNHAMPLTEGLHPPIVDRSVWDQAQTVMKSRSHAPVPKNCGIVNPLSGLVYCSVCGRSMERRKFTHGRDMLMCPTKDCPTKGSVLEEVEASLLDSLRLWLADYKVTVPADRAEADIAASLQEAERTVSRLEISLSTLLKQKESLYDLLEQGVYSTDIFLSRSQVLAQKTAETETALSEARAQLQSEQALAINQLSIVPKVERVLEQYPTLESPKQKNDLLKEVLQKVFYTKTQGSRYIPSDMSLYLLPHTK